MMRGRTLILGVGNLLAGDDGFGVHAVRRLLEQGVPEGVDVEDGATGGVDLLELMAAYDRVIVIDMLRIVEGTESPGGCALVAADSVRGRGSGTMGGLVGGERSPRRPVPGEVVVFRLNRVEFPNPDPYLSLHGCSLGGIVRLARALDLELPAIDVVGYASGGIQWSTELSTAAQRALDDAVRRVRALLEEGAPAA